MLSGPLALLVLLGAPTPAPTSGPSSEAPPWSASEMKTLFSRIEIAGRTPSVEQKDSELANIGGFAYRVPRQPGESTEVYARRTLKKRDANHPSVKSGQWIYALMRQFYDDASKRCLTLGRFERDRHDRTYFDRMANDARAAADTLAGSIETVVEGVEGFVAPLAIAKGEPPSTHGALASVKNGAITIEQLERVRFQNDAPAPDVIRTVHGAIRELFAAQKQYNVSAQMLGMYEAEWRKNKGNLRVLIPSASPSIYLNELVRGALEAEMETVHVMTMSPTSELSELAIRIGKPKPPPRRGKAKKTAPEAGLVEVKCANDVPMQKCVDRIADARSRGLVLYRVE